VDHVHDEDFNVPMPTTRLANPYATKNVQPDPAVVQQLLDMGDGLWSVAACKKAAVAKDYSFERALQYCLDHSSETGFNSPDKSAVVDPQEAAQPPERHVRLVDCARCAQQGRTASVHICAISMDPRDVLHFVATETKSSESAYETIIHWASNQPVARHVGAQLQTDRWVDGNPAFVVLSNGLMILLDSRSHLHCIDLKFAAGLPRYYEPTGGKNWQWIQPQVQAICVDNSQYFQRVAASRTVSELVDCVVVVGGLPSGYAGDKLAKFKRHLLSKLKHELITPAYTIIPQNLDAKSQGVAFLEFESKGKAEKAAAQTNGFKWDRQHNFRAMTMSTCERLSLGCRQPEYAALCSQEATGDNRELTITQKDAFFQSATKWLLGNHPKKVGYMMGLSGRTSPVKGDEEEFDYESKSSPTSRRTHDVDFLERGKQRDCAVNLGETVIDVALVLHTSPILVPLDKRIYQHHRNALHVVPTVQCAKSIRTELSGRSSLSEMLSAIDENGCTPFVYKIAAGRIDIASLFLSWQMDVGDCTEDECLETLLGVFQPSWDAILLDLVEAVPNIGEQDKHAAQIERLTRCVAKFATKRAPSMLLNINLEGMTALMAAVVSRHYKLAGIYVAAAEHGADVSCLSVQSHDKKSIFHILAADKSDEARQLLSQVLLLLASTRSESMLQAEHLITADAPALDLQDQHSRTAFLVSVANCNFLSSMMILQTAQRMHWREAVENVDSDGRTALHHCCITPCPPPGHFIKRLLSSTKMASVLDMNGRTALFTAFDPTTGAGSVVKNVLLADPLSIFATLTTMQLSPNADEKRTPAADNEISVRKFISLLAAEPSMCSLQRLVRTLQQNVEVSAQYTRGAVEKLAQIVVDQHMDPTMLLEIVPSSGILLESLGVTEFRSVAGDSSTQQDAPLKSRAFSGPSRWTVVFSGVRVRRAPSLMAEQVGVKLKGESLTPSVTCCHHHLTLFDLRAGPRCDSYER
jgi:hypothetical protein